eukprot:3226379-Amphidinium_carterae.1
MTLEGQQIEAQYHNLFPKTFNRNLARNDSTPDDWRCSAPPHGGTPMQQRSICDLKDKSYAWGGANQMKSFLQAEPVLWTKPPRTGLSADLPPGAGAASAQRESKFDTGRLIM